jgi:hypothetical protein
MVNSYAMGVVGVKLADGNSPLTIVDSPWKKGNLTDGEWIDFKTGCGNSYRLWLRRTFQGPFLPWTMVYRLCTYRKIQQQAFTVNG